MIRVKREGSHDLPLPAQTTNGAAGFDLASTQDCAIYPGQRMAIDTGFAWEIPRGFVGFIWPRSGLAFKYGVDTLAGCIDSDYRGTVKVILINHGEQLVEIKKGERIAQMVVQSCASFAVEESNILDETARAGGGFGSTGM